MEKLRESLKVKKERAILVAAVRKGSSKKDYDNLAELTALAESAGANIVDRFQQQISDIKPGTYIGRGKAEMLADRVTRFDADVVIFDNNLSPRQIRELEKIIKIKVLDRSELILDIFASRAQTKQAKLQVDLAQLEYTYPRLTRMWSHLDTVTGAAGGGGIGGVGGIGTRGTGEKQLEIDRRLVNKRITELKQQLSKIDERKMREIDSRNEFFKICLVGYTNTGKSTLLNLLTDAEVLAEDRLFATLDTRTRKWKPERGVEILLSDTVGFVRNLPHQLVASFKATLEEAINANLLLHVVDIANPEALDQIESVNKVLREIGCGKQPSIKVFNKVDAVKQIGQLDLAQALYPDAVCVSAKTGVGLDQLSEKVLDIIKGQEKIYRITISQANGKLLGHLHFLGNIIDEQYEDDMVFIDIKLGENQLSEINRLRPEKIEQL